MKFSPHVSFLRGRGTPNRSVLGACTLYDAIQHGLGMITGFENGSNTTRSLNLLHGNTFENGWQVALKIFACDV